MGVKAMGTIEEIFLISIRKITKEEENKIISLKRWRKLKRRNPRMMK